MANAGKIPEHEAIYLRIRQMVLFGELAPGQAVTILGLRDKLGAGMTPVREAIRRLTAEGALERADNRRVRVPLMTANVLDELYFARITLEPRLARMAAERHGPALADALQVIDQTLDQAILSGDIRGYLEHNYKFHFCLYEAAGAQVLFRLVSSLWLRIGPSLRIMGGLPSTRDLPDKHAAAIAALRANAPDQVAQLIEEDLRQGMDQVALSLRDGSFDHIG